MISFEPFRRLIRERNISTYYLRRKCENYNLDSKTIKRLMEDESVSTNTIDSLCQIFHCGVEDIMRVELDNKGENDIDSNVKSVEEVKLDSHRECNMTFSEFVQMLYPWCSNGANHSAFVIEVTDKIMSGRPKMAHADGGYQNPLRAKDTRSLEMYFQGTRDIPQSAASIFLESYTKRKFSKYVNGIRSEDALKSLREGIRKKGYIDRNNRNKTTGELCADLFVEILRELATA